jgi:hypothetical protein
MKEFKKFRKLPVVIEAIRWDGANFPEIKNAIPNIIDLGCVATDKDFILSWSLSISTLEGNMICALGDWIIKGVKGEFYPCKPDIFEKTYEEMQ